MEVRLYIRESVCFFERYSVGQGALDLLQLSNTKLIDERIRALDGDVVAVPLGLLFAAEWPIAGMEQSRADDE